MFEYFTQDYRSFKISRILSSGMTIFIWEFMIGIVLIARSFALLLLASSIICMYFPFIRPGFIW